MIDINELRRLAQAVTGWSNCNQAWLDASEDVLAAVVGHIDESGETYPVAIIDCDKYSAAHQSLPLARFYAAANPGAISELLDRLEAAEQTAQDYLQIDGEKARIAQLLEAAEQERDALRAESDTHKALIDTLRAENAKLHAKIAEMERQEPVRYELQGRDGSWYPFSTQRHYENTVADGSWPIRALYALPGAQPAPSFADAYQGAMEEVAIWKKRALEAEDVNRKFIADINGPTHMGEPAQTAPSVPEGFALVNAAHLLAVLDREDWRTAKNRAELRAMLAAAPKLEGE